MRSSSPPFKAIALLVLVVGSATIPRAAFPHDVDGDHVPDAVDAFPCDKEATAAAFYPAQGEFATLLYKDSWPSHSDNDYNDVVLAYNYIFRLNADGQVTSLQLAFTPLALGEVESNGLGLHLPVDHAAVESVYITREGRMAQSLELEADNEATVRLQTNLRRLFPTARENAEGMGTEAEINSFEDAIPSRAVHVEIRFRQAVSMRLDQAPFDLFLFKTMFTYWEIHLPQYGGTAGFDSVVARGSDDPTFDMPADPQHPGLHFVDRRGLPWVLNVPKLIPWTAQTWDLAYVFPDLIGFASSGGNANTDWYLSRIDDGYVYHSHSGDPRPRFLGPDIGGGTLCIPKSNLAGELGNERSSFIYASAFDTDNTFVVTGYVRATGQIAGDTQMLVAKYDAVSGREIWSRQLGGAGEESGFSIAIDAMHNIYVVGETSSRMFETEAVAGSYAAFLLALDPMGNRRFTRVIGGSDSESAYGVALDVDGNIFVAGESSSSDLRGTLFPGNTPASFVARYGPTGTLAWINQYLADPINPTNYSFATAITVDRLSGNVYTAGSERRYNGNMHPAANQYVARINPANGAVLWANHIGGNGVFEGSASFYRAFAHGVAVDELDGSVYVAGHWSGNVAQWDEWSRLFGDWSADATLTKVNPQGTLQWSRTLSSPDGGDEYGEGVFVDPLQGRVFLLGRTSGALLGQQRAGGLDYFIQSLNPNGSENWAIQNGTQDDDATFGMIALNDSQSAGRLRLISETAGNLASPNASIWDLQIREHDLGTGALGRNDTLARLGWRVGDFSPCSAACGAGTMTRTVQCARKDGTTEPDTACSDARPPTEVACIGTSCQYRWVTGNWNSCEASCGLSPQTRAVSCGTAGGARAPGPGACAALPEPAFSEPCASTMDCGNHWNTGNWSQCNAECGGGLQGRTVTCRTAGQGDMDDRACSEAGPRPDALQSCNIMACQDATTCFTLLRDGEFIEDGYHLIQPFGTGGPEINAYCDQTNRGGGWTNLDFTRNRIVLDRQAFIQCKGGLSANETSITCNQPKFNDSPEGWLFGFACDGSDRSAHYLLEEVGRFLGHNESASLGFTRLSWRWNMGSEVSDIENEYCYANGHISKWRDPGCMRYREARGVAVPNGNCVPSFFTLTR